MRKFFRISVLFLLACAIVSGMSACADKGEAKESASSDTVSWRDEYVEELPEVFIDKDGDFEYETVDWQGPDGYRIVIPAGDLKAKSSAEYLKRYFSSALGTDVPIVDDKTSETEKEILIGNTSRRQSTQELGEGEMSVFLDGQRLVFSGGHYVSVDSAVKKFVRLAPENGRACVFELKTDFVASKLDGYEYVWGDEFEGDDIDLTKWDFEACMAGTEMMQLSYDREIIDTSDGRLKLRAIRVRDSSDEALQFKVPYSTVTKYKMNYTYGYAEIRARMPFTAGVWPSFWGLSNGELGPKRNSKYYVEIDVFEVFGSLDTVIPNIHKHYLSDYDYTSLHDTEYTGGNHTSYGLMYETSEWVFKNVKTIGQEYHTYGYEWTEKEASMYVDGNKYMTYDIASSYDKCSDNSGFHDPLFLMFNFHIFSPDFSSIVSPIEGNYDSLPSEYDIDYFRLYQKPGKGKLYVDETVREYAYRQ